MWPSLDSFFLLCRVRTLNAFIPRSPAAHTTPSCLSAALSSHQALKEGDGEGRGVFVPQSFETRAVFSRGSAGLHNTYRSVSLSVMAVCVQYYSTNTHTQESFQMISGDVLLLGFSDKIANHPEFWLAAS